MAATFRGVVEKLVYSGRGLVRSPEHGIVFLSNVVPQEEVSYVLCKTLKRFSNGMVTALHTTAADRTVPQCLHYGKCGGCQLQHLQYGSQVATKKRWIEESFERIARMSVPDFDVVPAPAPFAYRTKVRLSISRDPANARQVQIGYVSTESDVPSQPPSPSRVSNDRMTAHREIVQVTECPIFEGRDDFGRVVSVLREAFSAVDWSAIEACRPSSKSTHHQRNTIGDVLLFSALHSKQNLSCIITVRCQKGLENVWSRLQQRVSTELPGCEVTVHRANHDPSSLQHARGTWEVLLGTPSASDTLHITYSKSSFVQVLPELAETIYRDIVDAVLEQYDQQGYRGCVLDLYGGIGIVGLWLAKHQLVCHSVELDRVLVDCARENAKNNNVHNATFHAMSVEDFMNDNSKASTILSSACVAVLNPPRSGLSDIVRKQLAGCSNIRTVVYMSCDPATLARDVASLFDLGSFQCKSLRAYDMFPQTTHVETVAILERQVHTV
ncbi:mitochondrial large subunit rRNA m5U methyltransferase RumA [Andalucia godoyi]|uniref:Mitochondrial large subunit rRNA m5U methyltransferase RumA n=1 Tax=Andalucia godoyi TaxID=505711 RepID=A0A8K0AJR3_ANDGO|nr:mitochondrial large subunit rRNA m5U methyltransferase RumA [Andalucia godoyi]|eukprot:ANDGO_00459.mRNA.1 mitochondrial large subunit rRNA m5U methyltransferase RumA